MCLLDEVTGWDAERISCRTRTHRAADNPLRARGRLGIACGIEYAAQTMAAHGALLAGGAAPTGVAGSAAAASPAAGSPAAGFLAGVRGMLMYASRLDDVPGELICEAVRIAGDAATALYDFELRSATAPLLRGRATVLLGARPRL
jgi:predicted hotdog family 3-hydroxylacyl-ACP dehydratase